MITAAIGIIGTLRGAVGSPITRYALIAAAGIAFVAYQRHDAASDAEAKAALACREAVAEKTQTEVSRQDEVNETVLAGQLERAVKAEREAKERLDAAENIISSLKAKGRDCTLPADVLRELQRIK